MSVSWIPVWPFWAVALITCALLALLAHGSVVLARKRLPRRWIIALAVLRTVIVLVFALCLLQPVVSFQRTVQERPPVLVMLDASRSMNSPFVQGEAPLLREAMRWMDAKGLQRALVGADWFTFDAHAHPLATGVPRSLVANGKATRYAESLREAWEHLRRQRGEDAATGGRVLLVSDGLEANPQEAIAVARRLGLKIDTLAPVAAAGFPQSRVSVVRVQAPRRVLLGAEARFAVTLRQEGPPAPARTLRLKEGEKPVAAQPITFTAEQPEQTVSIAFRPEEAGLKEYTLEMEAAPPLRFSVQVAGARNEVLFLEDSWRWEFKFLRRIFEDDPSFTLTAFLSRGGSAYVQLAEPDRRTQVNGFPQSRAELAGFDTFVLGSADPRRWPRGFAPALRQLVEEEGKSLIVIAGPNLRTMVEQPGLAELLPVELSAESAAPVAGPVAVRVTAEGLASPFFDAPGSAALWAALPPLDGLYPALRKKPAATALLEAAQLNNSYGPLIAMAEHPVGRGRVLFVATDTLWKWQMLAANAEGPTPYQVFWQQALRTLAPIRQSTGNVNLNLTPDRSRYEPGQTVTLRAEIQSARPWPKARVQAQVSLPDGKQLPLAFTPSPDEAGLQTARFTATMAGQHKIAATVIVEEKTAADSLIAFDVEPSAGELTGAPINKANLARLSRETGGRVIDRDNPATWRDLTHVEAVPVVRRQTVDLWNSYVLLITLSVLLGVDWLLRLLRGFA